MTQNYPLQWPQGWPRARYRKRAQFKTGGTYGRMPSSMTVAAGVTRIFNQLRLLGGVLVDDVVISTNVPVRIDGTPRSGEREPGDPGVAVYWKGKAGPRVMAIDVYDRVADNLAAIAATLEAMRAIERHGGAQILERAFTGFTALPSAEAFDHWAALGLKPGSPAAEIEAKFRELAKRHHPDVDGGTVAEFQRIQRAREAALREVGA